MPPTLLIFQNQDLDLVALQLYFASQRHMIFYSPLNMATIFLSQVVLSYLVALGLAVMIEVPLLRLERLIVRRSLWPVAYMSTLGCTQLWSSTASMTIFPSLSSLSLAHYLMVAKNRLHCGPSIPSVLWIIHLFSTRLFCYLMWTRDFFGPKDALCFGLFLPVFTRLLLN